MSKNHTKNFSLSLPHRLKNRLESEAERKMMSQSSLVRRVLDENLPEGDSA